MAWRQPVKGREQEPFVVEADERRRAARVSSAGVQAPGVRVASTFSISTRRVGSIDSVRPSRETGRGYEASIAPPALMCRRSPVRKGGSCM